MGFNLTGNEIKNTYERLVTISGSIISNGTGSDISNLTITASNATTASFAQTANSSSYALTASFALNVPVTASYAISASQAQNAVNANNATSASFASTAASAATAISASYALSASQAQNSVTANSATSASYALSASRSETSNAAATAVSASHAVTASFALSSVAANTGSLLITGSVSNATLVFTKGDNSTFPLTVNNVQNASTASIATSASFASTAATAASATSASYALTASYAQNAEGVEDALYTASVSNATITFTKGDASTFGITVNNVSNASTASIATTAASASYVGNAVLTGSSVANSLTFTKFDGSQFTLSVETGSGFPFVGNAQITGSLNVSGSITLKSGSFSGSLVDNITDVYTPPVVEHVVTLTQAEYNALTSPDVNTFYIISDGGGVSTTQFATTGSNTFVGNQTISGSVNVTGSLTVTGSVNIPSITGSLLGTASNATSASYALTASYLEGGVAAFPYTGSAQITGSLGVTSSFEVLAASTSRTYIRNAGTSGQKMVFNDIISSPIGSGSNDDNFLVLLPPSTPSVTLYDQDVLIGGYSYSHNITGGGGGNFYLMHGTSNEGVSGFHALNNFFGVVRPELTSFGGGSYGNGFFGGETNRIRRVSSAHIFGGLNNIITDTTNDNNRPSNQTILGGSGNIISGSDFAVIIGGKSNTINYGQGDASQNTKLYSAIIASTGSVLNHSGSVILGGQGINSTQPNTVYVPRLQATGSGTFVQKLVVSQSVNDDTNGALVVYSNRIGQDLIRMYEFGTQAYIKGARVNASLYVEAGGGSNDAVVVNGSVNAYTGRVDITRNTTISGSLVITGSVRGEVSALTISSNTASLDCSRDNFFTIQLVSGSTTYINPSNIQPGQTINLLVNTTGSGLVSFPSSVKQVSGSSYVPTTTTGVDVVTFISFDTSSLLLSNVKNLI
jgi:hypothetical protein